MKISFKIFSFLIFLGGSIPSFSQQIVSQYYPVKNDRLRVGTGENDVMPYIQKGYTLMLPDEKPNAVLIFLEDSGYDQKNGYSKQLYELASTNRFAVLSVSTELPFDFYFSNHSLNTTHELIQEVFTKYQLPNENIFFLGASLVGHRAMRYIKFMKEGNVPFQLNIKGLVLCDFTLDFTRKWYQHERDIKINRINLWEPTFINYMLETYLGGTPKTNPENYYDFSTYSYFDEKNENVKLYQDYAVIAYVEPAIQYRLKKYVRTLYENNATDMVGFLAELELAGNENTELIVLHNDDSLSEKRNSKSTWNAINKQELIDWIREQTEK